jgi:hypothetical protein
MSALDPVVRARILTGAEAERDRAQKVVDLLQPRDDLAAVMASFPGTGRLPVEIDANDSEVPAAVMRSFGGNRPAGDA